MLNKIKLNLLKTTQKKIIIGVLCFLFFIFTSFHSSLIFADSISSGNGTFSYGTYQYQKNIYTSLTNINIDGISINSYGSIVIDVYLNNTYTGNLYINGISSSGMLNGGSYFCYGASFVTFNSSNNRILLLINEPTDHIKVVYTVNGSDMHTYITNSSIGVSGSLVISEDTSSALSDIDIKLSSCSNTLQQILSALQSGGSIYEYLDDINLYLNQINSSNETLSNYMVDLYELLSEYQTPALSYLKYIENQSQSGDDISSYEYISESLGANSYTYKTSSGRGIKRIEAQLKTRSIYNGNYVVFQYLFHCISIQDQDVFKNITIRNREQSSTYLIDINDAVIYLNHYDFTNQNSSIIYLTLYIPITNFAEYNNGEYRIDILNFYLTDVKKARFQFMGIVESLPDIEPYNFSESQISSDIKDVADDIANTSSDINDVEQQYINDLNDFKNNLDLSDYNFNLTNRTGFEYLREKLTDIYEINEFKPFYLVPIIFFVLTIVLGG